MTETRWLNDDEQRTWRAFLWMSQLLQEALDRQMRRDTGMPHAYYIILAMLSETPGRTLTMTELARIIRSSPSRLSHAVARLEQQGWVRREGHPRDRRTTLAVLTDAGHQVVVSAAPGHVAEVRRALFDQLTPEQVTALHEICRAALAVLEPDPTDPPPPDC